MKKLVKSLCAMSLAAFLGSCTLDLSAAPPMSEISRLKFNNNNNIPSKVLVVSGYGNQKFVKDLFDVIKKINVTEQLSGNDLIKLHIISGGGDPISGSGISAEDANKYVEVNPKFNSSDIWMQDCMELCSAVLKNGKLVPAVFDSNRGRGLGRLPGVLAQMWDTKTPQTPRITVITAETSKLLRLTTFS